MMRIVLLLALLVSCSLCSTSSESIAKALHLQATFLLQKSEFEETSHSFKELLVDLREIAKSDESQDGEIANSQILRRIDDLMPRLRKEKVEIEEFLQRIVDHRLAIANEKSELESQKRDSVEDLTEMKSKLATLEADELEYSRSWSQLQHNFDEQKARIDRAVRDAKARAPSWARWAWPVVIGVDEVSGRGRLTMTAIKLGNIDLQLHSVRDHVNRMTAVVRKKRIHVNNLDSKIETLEKSINEMTTIFRKISDWDKHLSRWIDFLSDLIPRGARIQENVAFEDEEVIRESLVALKDSLTAPQIDMTIDGLMQSIDQRRDGDTARHVGVHSKHCFHECPNGWSLFSSSCYKVFQKRLIFGEAENYCQGEDGHLVSIHDTHENVFVFNLSKQTDSWWIWIGLRRNAVNANHFEWTDGSPVDYTNWSPNEPNNSWETGVAMNLRHPSLLKSWNDLPPGDPIHTPTVFICKKPQPKVCF